MDEIANEVKPMQAKANCRMVYLAVSEAMAPLKCIFETSLRKAGCAALQVSLGLVRQAVQPCSVMDVASICVVSHFPAVASVAVKLPKSSHGGCSSRAKAS